MSTSPQNQQAERRSGSTSTAYPTTHYPVYHQGFAHYNTPFAGFGQYNAHLATGYLYPAIPTRYNMYNGYRPVHDHHNAYTYPATRSVTPSSSRSHSPTGSAPRPSTPVAIRSVTPPTTPLPAPMLTPAQFVDQLHQIRLQNRPAGSVIGRFHLVGESLPVSVSQPRKNGPFVIQHYLPDGRADVVSVAHVFEFEGHGAERGVIVWCPPPRVQYFGMNT
ncbi:hypothetical protein RhiJN_11626 [Ceratobasidium sp. AG-Ba]|nr:hypothetical protein RhiJN_11626 [Ceratobasidium sp. AG-Ba]QRW12297.1 hypothetical protein RhiLY_11296 [Ceratobasidium sp. AG-Ba]